MKPFLDLLQNIVDNGVSTPDRTGTGRRRIFGTQTRFNLQEGFPLLTTQKVFTRGFTKELEWFIKGITDNKYLTDDKVNIWKLWEVREEHINVFIDKYMGHQNLTPEFREAIFNKLKTEFEFSIGKLYGSAWRNSPVQNDSSIPVLTGTKFDEIASDHLAEYQKLYDETKLKYGESFIMNFEQFAVMQASRSVDQLGKLMYNLKKYPYSARHVVSTWIPEWVAREDLTPQENVMFGNGSLAPCHVLQQYYVLPPVTEGGKPRISLQMYQRSVDTPVGASFNIAQYSLLLALVAHVLDYEAYEFIWTTGDTHIYLDQLDLVKEQLSREPLPLCKIKINPELKDLFQFKVSDVEYVDYKHHPHIKYPVSM